MHLSHLALLHTATIEHWLLTCVIVITPESSSSLLLANLSIEHGDTPPSLVWENIVILCSILKQEPRVKPL